MAQVDFSKTKVLNKSKYVLQEEVESTYSVFERDGKEYFQIETYGRNSRKLKGKPSQILQLDKKSAEELIKILKTFIEL